ncbi:MAG: nitrous oxide reductase family maturation protein NosD [Gammaproteobacteria bacterium]|nr:nitrous oxide reductase family maturation protein NosD [Gammaproteobacteria bacterium]
MYCSLMFLYCTSIAAASVVQIEPGPDALKQALAAARPGDTLQLQNGLYSGPVIIEQSINLVGQSNTVIDGANQGKVITVSAPDVVIRNIKIQHSGIDLSVEDSGIFITAEGDRSLIENNQLYQNLIGIYLKGPDDVIVRNNMITGRNDLRMNERGNGVQLWNSPGSIVDQNKIQYGRDGIFVTTSNNNKFLNNQFRDLRFAIHYMYTNQSEISGNSSNDNHVAYALMYSHHLKVSGNTSTGDRDRGILFNFTNYSDIKDNIVHGSPEKCVFIYNSNFNDIHANKFEGCDIGVHFTAGSEQNKIWNNAFINNKTQVKYVGTRFLEWSNEGQGNYWSDHTAFDLDGDNVADKPYRPNNLADQILWRHPMSKILLNSPVLQVLRWSQSQFPGLHPGGITDSAPMMAPIL